MAFYHLLITGFIILVISCVFLVKYYKSPSVTMDVTIAVYLSWVLGFAGILVLPFDMSEALLDRTKLPLLNELWHFIYWSTFALAWGILPIQMSYHTSGGFDFNAKIKEAFYQNILFYVVSGVVGIIYIIAKAATSGASIYQVIGFLMALGNTYGVLMIIALMGNGLISLPRRLWQLGNPDTELTRLYMLAPSVESSYCDARYELEDCEEEVKRVSQTSQGNPEITNMALIMSDRVSSFNFSCRSTSLLHSQRKSKNDKKETYEKKDLITLHKRLIQAQLKVLACDRRWRILLTAALRLQELAKGNIISDASSWCQMPTAPTGPFRSLCASCSQSCEQFRIIWYLYVFKYVCRLIALICAFASSIILWSEIANPTKLQSPIGQLLLAATSSDSHSETSRSFLSQIIIFLSLAYMSICTYWCLFRINIGWAYTMQGPHLSPSSSMLFNGTYFCRLQFYIGYNFILFLNVKKMKNTSLLSDMMTNIELVPIFGSSFATYAPILTAIIAVFTLFNGYARILKMLGIDSEDAVSTNSIPCMRKKMDADEEERMNEGKKLVTNNMHMIRGNNNNNIENTNTNNITRANDNIVTVSSHKTNISRRGWRDDESDRSADSKTGIISPLHISENDIESGRNKKSTNTAGVGRNNSSVSSISDSSGFGENNVTPAPSLLYGSKYSPVQGDSSPDIRTKKPEPYLKSSSATAGSQDLFSSAAQKGATKTYTGRYS